MPILDSKSKIQVWPSIRQSTWNEIEEMAKKERRKFNDMVAVLIENAVKERKRKRRTKQSDEA
jgi:hypothetical protein